jgi:hypothetical protein
MRERPESRQAIALQRNVAMGQQRTRRGVSRAEPRGVYETLFTPGGCHVRGRPELF